MGAQFGGIAFVVWRESVEALLVIGILDSWLAGRGAETRRARAYLWGGVAAGLAVAGLLAVVLVSLDDAVPDSGRQAFQTVLVLIAAALIVQMLIWMRRNARDMKTGLENAVAAATGRRNWWGVLVLALSAVAREGSETVVFLTGLLAAGPSGSRFAAAGAGGAGLAAALLTYAALRLAGRRMPWRVFFRITEVMLLFLGAALVMTGIDGLIDLDILPSLGRRVWDSSLLLSDGSAFGGFVSNLTGYRARPIPMELIAFAGYWLLAAWLLWRPARRRPFVAEA